MKVPVYAKNPILSAAMEKIADLGSLLELDELKDTVLHFLDGLVFGETHSPLVGDVVNAALGFGVLSAGATDLEVVLGGHLLELGVVGSQHGHLLLNLLHSTDQAAVHFAEITAHLHGDDSEVILFVAPDQEGLLVVVVDTTA